VVIATFVYCMKMSNHVFSGKIISSWVKKTLPWDDAVHEAKNSIHPIIIGFVWK